MDWSQIEFFTADEWGEGWENVDPNLIYLLDEIRSTYDKPIIIHCAFAQKGHSPKSQHYLGKAVDFHFKDSDYVAQYNLLRSYDVIGGLGAYMHWTHPGFHIDLRPNRLYWTADRSGGYIYGQDAIEKAVYRAMQNG